MYLACLLKSQPNVMGEIEKEKKERKKKERKKERKKETSQSMR